MYTVFVPVLVLLALTVIVLLCVPGPRIAATKADPALMKEAATNAAAFPSSARKFANNFDNLMQLPMLFYIGALFAILFGATSWTVGVAAWAFVAARIAHSLVHVTVNAVPVRFLVFVVGLIALIAFWVQVAMAGFGSEVLVGGGHPSTILGALHLPTYR